MKILVIGSGGVGTAVAAIARRRDFFSTMIMTDIDEGRAKTAAERTGDNRFQSAKLDASDWQQSQRSLATTQSTSF